LRTEFEDKRERKEEEEKQRFVENSVSFFRYSSEWGGALAMMALESGVRV
jgi:hypothetical protein